MADDSIVIEIKDKVDNGIATKIRDIGSAAKAAQKDLDGVQKSLNSLSAKPLTAVTSSANKASESLQKVASAQRSVASSSVSVNRANSATAASSAKLNTALASQATQFNKAGLSVKQYNAAMRGVPAQITDIVVSLQGGQKPLTVLLQQGGQLKDMFGGIRPALGALASGLLALINPFTITAAVVIGLTTAFLKGQQELINYNKEVTITGNIMASTSGEFAAFQNQLASVGTKGKAAEALTEIAKAGNLAGSQIGNIAKASILMEKATGQAIEDTVAQFKKLADEPTKASAELNKQYNYLTLSVYEQIRALEKQGRVTDAAVLAEKSYADALTMRASEVIRNAGLMEKAWNGVAGAAKSAWDAILDIGRPQTVADLEKRLKAIDEGTAERRRNGGGTEVFEKNAAIARKEIEAQLDTLRESERLSKRQAQGAAEYQRTQNEGIAASEAVAKITADTASKQDNLTKALKEYRMNLEKIRKANPDSAALNPDTISKTEANIREKYKTPKSSQARQEESRASALAKVNLQLDNEIRLLSTLGPEREKQEMFDRIEEGFAGRRIKLTDTETQAIQKKIQAIVEGARASAEYNRIYEEANAPLQEYQATLSALATLVQKGRISQERATAESYAAMEAYKAATQPLYEYNKAVDEAAKLRGIYGDALEVEIQLQALLAQALAKKLPLDAEETKQLKEKLRLELERTKLEQARAGLIASGPGAREGASTQIKALGELKASGAGGFTSGDAASATNDVLKSMGIDTNSFQVALNTQAMAYEEYFKKLKELRTADLISAQELSDAELQLKLQQFGTQFQQASTFFTGLSELQKSKSKEGQRIGKAAAIANTTIQTYQSATSAYAAMAGIPYIGPALGIAAAAAAVAAGLANVQAIRSQGTGSYSMGGYTGSGSAGQVAGTAHKEEYIFDAASTRRIGVSNLAALRSGSASVGSNSKSVSTSSSGVKLTVINNGTPQVYEQQPGLTADEVRLIARDVTRKEAPQVVAANIKNPNSEVRKSMSAYTNVTRRETS